MLYIREITNAKKNNPKLLLGILGCFLPVVNFTQISTTSVSLEQAHWINTSGEMETQYMNYINRLTDLENILQHWDNFFFFFTYLMLAAWGQEYSPNQGYSLVLIVITISLIACFTLSKF